ESSPYQTLGRGAFSASSLVTPTRRLRPGSAWFPFATVTLSLPTPPHTASGHGCRSTLLSSFREFFHGHIDDQPSPALLTCQRPGSSGPPPSLSPSQNPGQAQERSPSSGRGRPRRSSAHATSSRGRHRHRFTLPLGLRRLHHRRRFLLDSRVSGPYGWPESHCRLPAGASGQHDRDGIDRHL